jgi:hypothetical protein
MGYGVPGGLPTCLESTFTGLAGIGREITLWTIPKNKTSPVLFVYIILRPLIIILKWERVLFNVPVVEVYSAWKYPS